MIHINLKYIIGSLFIGAVTLGGFTSCSLDEDNPSGEGADQAFVKTQGMEYLVNQLYYNFRWKYFGREDPVLYMEGSGDLWQTRANNYGYGKQLSRYIDLQGDRGQIAGAWNRVYDNINVANTIINRLDGVNDIDDKTKADFDGEARFMRSYCYWWLCEFFGDVELRTQETTTPVFTAVRTPRTQIYDQVIIPDAEKACEELPVSPYDGDVGRSTKKAAYALLARVCLTRAQYATGDSARVFYQKALDAANYVINNKAALGIKLYNTYDEIWQAKNNKTNTEFLWVCSHSSNPSLNPQQKNANRLHIYFAPKLNERAGITTTPTSWEYPKEMGGFSMEPNYYLLNLYADWDARYDSFFQEDFPENNPRGQYRWSAVMVKNFRAPESLVGKTVKDGQTVLKFTRKVVPESEREKVNYAVVDINDMFDTQHKTALGGARQKDINDTVATNTYIATSYPRFMKYRIWDRDPNGTFLLGSGDGKSGANTTVGFADVPLIRYAEVPLIAAECYIQLGQPAQAAQVINSEIRTQRIVKPGHSLSEAQVTASDMTIEWILAERARELCGEWLRWFDLKRTGKLVEYVRGHNPSMDGIDVVDEHNNLWPIPNTFLDKLQNAEEFGQNPGYDPYVRSGK